MNTPAATTIDKPIQVYLDKSTYWNLAKGQDDPSMAEALRLLCSFKENRSVEFRYSAIHVLELLKFNDEKRKNALARIEIMKLLSGDQTFRPLDKIIEFELSEALGSKLPPNYWLGSKGFWVESPSLDEFQKSLPSRMAVIEEMKSTIRGLPLQRHERRKMISKFVSSGNRLSKEGVEYLRANRRQDGISAISDKYPVTERFYSFDFFDEWLMGRQTDLAFYREALRGLLDPANLAAVYRDHVEFKKSESFDWVQKFGLLMFREFSDFGDQVRTLIEQNNLDLKSGSKLASNAIDKLDRSRVSSRLVARTLEAKGIELTDEIFAKIRRQPIVRAFEHVFASYQRSFAKKPLQVPSKSDGGDLLHALYTPYVDIWYGDSKTCSYFLEGGNFPFKAKLVSSLPQLIDALNVMTAK
ncbi:MAG: hypothetical protein LCH62_04335 [Proteobacteria bacterium]|nr:hypothetical protein [Pseudomonadota bacterium]